MLMEEFSFCDIMNVSQVCQHWQNAALGYKKIWATIININFKNESWVKELICHSGDSLLTIESVSLEDLPAPQDRFTSPKWTALWDEICQVETLDLDLLQSDESFISRMLQFDTPILKILHLSFPNPYDFRFNWGTPGWFHGSAPNLHCLTLTNISFNPWELMGLRLTHLEVNAINTLNIAPWLELLDSQHQLKHLTFWLEDLGFERYILGCSEGLPNVVLPNLETFHHSYISETSVDIFSHLILPLSCDVSLKWKIGHEDTIIDPIGTDNAVYQGLKRCFKDWANKVKHGQYFFWQIDIQNLCVSISTRACLENTFQEGPCIELAVEVLVIQGLQTDGVFDYYMNEVGSILLHMLVCAASPIMGYSAVVSVNAMHDLDKEFHSNFMGLLDLLLTSSRALFLAGDNIDDFITHIHRNTPAVLPNLSDILFEGDMSQGSITKQALIQYLYHCSQADIVRKWLPVLSLCPIDFDDLSAIPPCDEYHVQCIQVVWDVPSIECHQGCPSCPFWQDLLQLEARTCVTYYNLYIISIANFLLPLLCIEIHDWCKTMNHDYCLVIDK